MTETGDLGLLRELYDYVSALEGAAGGLLYTHGGKMPPCAPDLGDRVRERLGITEEKEDDDGD